MSIRLQFVAGADLSSRFIAWYGNGYRGFSHVDAVLPGGFLLGARSDAIGGQPPGVRVRPPDYGPRWGEKWLRRSVIEFSSTATQAYQWERWLGNQCGKQYDDAAIFGFILGRRWHKLHCWICSALQCEALVREKFIRSPGVPAAQITPDTLHACCLAAGAVIAE
jgi:hypothetical protein